MNLQQRDKLHLWHPYTQHKTAQDNIAIVRGKGTLLWDENGKEYIDAIASWWVNPYGHSNTVIAEAIYKQLTTLEHVLFGGFTHPPAVELSEKLIPLLPNNQQKLFFTDNGSTAIEVAIKIAIKFYYNKRIKRTKIVAFENAFHGDTFGAMSVSGISIFSEAFEDQLIEVIRIPVPKKGKEAAALTSFKNILNSQEVAAFIFEPLVQGAAGMVMYKPKWLDQLIVLAKKHNVITIADEVMTGFGKTGKHFACHYLSEKPDMVCISKALTAGAIPMAITSTTQDIFDAFYDDDISKALFQGHTYTANPTGCAAALASINLLLSEDIQKRIQEINSKHLKFETHIKEHPKVENTRVLGVIFALDIKVETTTPNYGSLRDKLYAYYISNGIILRPIGNTVYILPPYIITSQQLQKIYKVVEESLNII